MKFKVGDEIIYLGTKEGYTDDDWDLYFGQYGIKRGSKGVIKSISDDGTIFVKDDGRSDTSGRLFEKDLDFPRKITPKTPTHVVIWDEESRDPHQFFISEKKAKVFIKELSEKSEVKKDSIILVEIKSSQKVKVIRNVRLSNYKI